MRRILRYPQRVIEIESQSETITQVMRDTARQVVRAFFLTECL